VGSTKAGIVAHAEKNLPKNVYFIGTHPMAGSEKAGAEFADVSLFEGSICFITKTNKSNHDVLMRVAGLWKLMGANTVVISPKKHDNIVGQISHLPHLLSVALVDCVEQSFIKYAAAGFKDTTRIAAGDPQIWKDISFSNKQAIIASINNFEKKLNQIKKAIKNDQKQKLVKQLIKAKRKRDILK
jgi:prephenate dehydrogenase